jgi:hypothetical protein
MKDWQSRISYLFFGLAALTIGYTLVHLITLPLWGRAKAEKARTSDLALFKSFELVPSANYQKDLATHALFSKVKEQAAPVVIGLNDLIKPYSLTGVISGGQAEALIQNNATKQTYYLKAGEDFDKFKVLEVKNHSAVIGYQNEKKELFIEGEKQ